MQGEIVLSKTGQRQFFHASRPIFTLNPVFADYPGPFVVGFCPPGKQEIFSGDLPIWVII
jgi:hypothetical protein